MYNLPMKRRCLVLSEDERAELLHLSHRDPRPYRREQATALLKIADGMPAYQVARTGLVKARHPETVYLWLNAFEKTRKVPIQSCRRKRLSPPAGNDLALSASNAA